MAKLPNKKHLSFSLPFFLPLSSLSTHPSSAILVENYLTSRHSDDGAQKYITCTMVIFFTLFSFESSDTFNRLVSAIWGYVGLMWQHDFPLRVKLLFTHFQMGPSEGCVSAFTIYWWKLLQILLKAVPVHWWGLFFRYSPRPQGRVGYEMITGCYLLEEYFSGNIAPRVLAMPNLSWQLVQGFQASGMIQVIYGLWFPFKQFIAISETCCFLIYCVYILYTVLIILGKKQKTLLISYNLWKDFACCTILVIQLVWVSFILNHSDNQWRFTVVLTVPGQHITFCKKK